MKCPKCGYNSFEYNDNCPKCLNDLTGYKATYGIKAMALPLAARMDMARSMADDIRVDSHPAEAADITPDMFSFDFDDAGSGTAREESDPFDFDEGPTDSSLPGLDDLSFGEELQTAQAKAEEDAFASLLETIPQKSAAAPVGKPAVVNEEFDLENFSWDDTLDSVDDGKPAKPHEDDFGSLFGGAKK